MAVVIETTLGDITVDLYLEQRPVTCLNFLKLCKMKYYNFNLFHTIRSGFIAQTGDPTGEGSGGQSIFGLLEGPEKRFFSGEKMPKIRHTNAGLLSMVCSDDMMVGSQFFFTLASDLDSLDGVHCVIGEVTEGHEVLRKLNEVICDETHRPYQDVRITHTVILEDPFNDPPGFRSPSRSPSPSAERLKGGRIAPDEEIDETQGKTAAEIQEIIEEKEAKARATILEIVGDLPDADIAPPENVLFVCKLNPVTTDEDLEIIFSRFGKIVSCEVIRDKKTGDSLQYAFIEFSDKKSCEDAYFKMDNVLIDDRRIHVDFSQSVSKMRWLGKGRGVQHLDDDGNVKGNQFKTNQDKERNRNNNHHQSEREKYHNSRYGDDKHKEREDRKTQATGHNNRSRQDKHNDKQYYHKDRSGANHERKKMHESEKQSRDRSRSGERTTSKSFRSRSDNHKNNDSVSSSKKYDANKKSKSDRNHSDRQKEKSNSPPKYTKDKEDKKRESSVENLNRKRKHSSNNNIIKHHRSNSCDNLKNKKSRRHNEDLDKKHDRMQEKENDKHVEPHTPPPAKEKKQRMDRKNMKLTEKNKKRTKRELNKKKKRKPSTSSSESESSDSSSSSTETSSSSDSDNRKKKRSRRKRKHSTSSSTESSDSSSSSSSTESSSSSSSSSDSERNRKRVRKTKKKVVKKIKKKS